MRVVIDTNCLVAAIPKTADAYWLYLAFRAEMFIWVVSTEILNEYFEILTDFYSPATADVVVAALIASPNIELAEPYFYYDLITKDPDDNKFANLAISTNAQYLVSNDKHFNIFKQIDFPPLAVIKLEEFRQVLYK